MPRTARCLGRRRGRIADGEVAALHLQKPAITASRCLFGRLRSTQIADVAKPRCRAARIRVFVPYRPVDHHIPEGLDGAFRIIHCFALPENRRPTRECRSDDSDCRKRQDGILRLTFGKAYVCHFSL